MATSGKTHGKNLVFKLDNQAGVLKDVTSYVRSVDGLPPELEQGDVTGGGATGYSYTPGLQKGDVKIEFVFDDTADSIWDIIKDYLSDTDTRSFEFGPAGSTSGYVKISGELRIKKVGAPAKNTDPLIWTMEAVLDGACTIGTWSA